MTDATNPDMPQSVAEADDLLYLVKLADWCAGQGFCNIEGIEEPEEWCFRKWGELHPLSDGSDYSAENLAAAMRAFPDPRDGVITQMKRDLEQIEAIGTGSTSVNSLQNIAKIARKSLAKAGVV